MDRGSSMAGLSWLLLPATALLAASALTLPLQPYTGLTLRGDEVMGVASGSPGDRAGIRPGDRLFGSSAGDAVLGPLSRARPGEPLRLERARGPTRAAVEVVPRSQPAAERGMMVLLLAVASGFLLLGGWVWSERRDPLTTPFFLLGLAFAVLLAPHPRLPWGAPALFHEVL